MSNADAAQLSELRALHAELGSEGALRLREWFEQVGPPAESMKAAIPEQVAVRWGVPPSLVVEWMKRDRVGRGQTGGPVLRAILVPLGDGDWTPRSELVRVGIEANEQYLKDNPDVAASENDGPADGATGRRSYRSSPRIVQHVLRERKRWDQVEVKEINGEEHMRLRPAPVG